MDLFHMCLINDIGFLWAYNLNKISLVLNMDYTNIITDIGISVVKKRI